MLKQNDCLEISTGCVWVNDRRDRGVGWPSITFDY